MTPTIPEADLAAMRERCEKDTARLRTRLCELAAKIRQNDKNMGLALETAGMLTLTFAECHTLLGAIDYAAERDRLLDAYATVAAERDRYRDAVAELCRLQYGTDPENVEAVARKYAQMRKDRLQLDSDLEPAALEATDGE